MSLPSHVIIAIVSITLISFISNEAFSQEESQGVSEQITLSEDLANNPVAQDILKKIEQTKQWIADLEKRNYEKTQAQKLLEEKRAIALERLNKDLEQWEILWSNYTSKAAFERFVAKKPSEVQGVFWDQFEFKEMKVNAGREALKKVIAEGGTMREAREAYLKAAETKRIELIESNAQFNIKYNLAYYKEQLLFDKQGEFINSTESWNTLGEFYDDYSNNPKYLKTNPQDEFAKQALQSAIDSQCREGYVLIHRFQQNDNVCVTEFSAQQWIRYGIGEKPGIAEIIIEADLENHNSISVEGKIEIINQEIREFEVYYHTRQNEIIKLYDIKYQNVDEEAKRLEREMVAEYSANENISGKDVSENILEIRNQIEEKKNQVLNEKVRELEKIQVEFDKNVLGLITPFEERLGITIIWNSSIEGYEAFKIES
ncbi:MAG TPA: hypothetical protein VD731_06225 [Nitrosopumilaceae archaeon]|nr:hypothetical protein [Nitrosopumilaceae archaeon]